MFHCLKYDVSLAFFHITFFSHIIFVDVCYMVVDSNYGSNSMGVNRTITTIFF